jgi:hypothetical protein
MTGPEHYREAEQLLGARRSGESAEEAASRLAEAQIHATLALAAATALTGEDDHLAWQETASERPPVRRTADELDREAEQNRERLGWMTRSRPQGERPTPVLYTDAPDGPVPPPGRSYRPLDPDVDM